MTVRRPAHLPLKGLHWVVAGAGVWGAAIAWRLAVAGARVTLGDPAPSGDNASGIAAGMLAAACEAALDPLAGLGLDQLLSARDLWPAFAAEAGIPIDRCGALLVGAGAGPAAERLAAIGADHEWLTVAQAQTLSPGLRLSAPAVFTPHDWRLDAPEALTRLIAAGAAAGVGLRRASITGWSQLPGVVRFADGADIAADGLVVATGAAVWAGSEHLPVAPFKGQIVRSRSGPKSGPVVRGAGAYIVPGIAGAVVGATMEPVNDRIVDPLVVKQLVDAGAALFPDLATAPHAGAAAVRASTPDGLPLVGWSSGALVAVGARRNGWLLAPLIAGLVVQLAEGQSDAAAPFDPQRFQR